MVKPSVLKAIDVFLDEYYEKSANAGRYLRECFPEEGAKNQVRNLENAAYTATRFSSIQNFIKNQMGKDSKKNPTWTKIISDGTVMGDFLLNQLEELAQGAEKLLPTDDLTQNNPQSSLEIRLRLARGWAQQVASHYFYLLVQKG